MPPSSPRRTPAIVLGLAALVIGLSCWGLYTSDGARKARERDERLAEAKGGVASAPEPALQVEALRVERGAAPEVVELSGSLEPVRRTWVAAEIAGSILEVPAQEHAPIAAGELLARLDPALPRAELVRAQAAHRLAQSELERQRRLGKRSIASESELDRAAAEERRSYAALSEARTRLGHTRIVSPFDGVVNVLDLDPGAYVQPGTRIAEVIDVSTLELGVALSDRQIGALTPGDAARVRIDSLGNAVFEGRVARVGRAPRPETQRYPVVVALDNPDGKLLAGMLAHVMVEVGRAETLRVPRRALLREFELDYVFLLEPGEQSGQARLRRQRVDARPVPFRPDWIEILGGLESGSLVAISSVSQLRDGENVRFERNGGPATP